MKFPQNFYFLLRHGETPYQLKKEKIHYPWPESSPILLTERGKKQIEILAKKLKQEKLDLIFSSDISRAHQTAKIIAQELGLKVNLDLRLRDINYGIYHGRPRKEFCQNFPDEEKRFYKAPKNGESWSDCKKRVSDFIEEIDKKYQGKKILIIAHGDPLWLLEGVIKDKTNKELLKEKIEGKVIKVGELRVFSV